MATVIDALLVTLGLDPAAFHKSNKEVQEGLKATGKEAEKAQKELDAKIKRTTEAMGKLRDMALDLTVAFVGAFAGHEYMESITRTDAAVGRLSKNLGMGADELSRWQKVGERIAGTSADDVTGMFKTFTGIAEDIKNLGGSDSLNWLAARANVDMGKFLGADQTQRALMLAEAMKKLNRQDAIFFAQKAGLAESQMNLILQVGKSDLETQERIGYVTTQQTEAALRRNQEWTRFGQHLDSIGHKLADLFSPVSEGAAGALNWGMEEHLSTTIGLVTALGGALAMLKGYAIASFAEQFTGGFAKMAVAAGELAGKLGLLGLAAGGGIIVGTFLDWAIGKGLSAATGRDTDLGGWLFDTLDDNDYTSPHPKGTRSRNGSAVGYGNINDAVAHQESGNRDYYADGSPVRSDKGALYAMQVLPTTAHDPGHGIRPASDNSPAEFNRVGRELLTALLRDFGGDMRKALAAYNWGERNVLRYGMDHLPPETANYVHNIMATIQTAKPTGNWGGSGSSVTVGDVHIHTTATDGAGMAGDFRRSLSNLTLAGQANTGLN